MSKLRALLPGLLALPALVLLLVVASSSPTQAARRPGAGSPRINEVALAPPAGASVAVEKAESPALTPTVTPTPRACGGCFSQSVGAAIVPATSLVPNTQCDDCSEAITLPFPISLGGQTYTGAAAVSNGHLDLVGNDFDPVSTCLPTNVVTTAIFGFWTDLDLRTQFCGPNCGIYTLTAGSPPNRQFYIEWRASLFGGTLRPVDFELRFYEGQANRFDIIYGEVSGGGDVATVGVQLGPSQFCQESCNTASLWAGLQLSYPALPCGTATATVTPTATRTATAAATTTASTTPATTPTQPCVSPVPTWTAVPTLPIPGRYNPAGITGGDGKFYVMGGLDTGNAAIGNNDAFDGVTNLWASLAPLPTPRANAASGALGNLIYLSGGNLTGGQFVASLDSYNTSTDTWTSLAPMPVALSGSQGWALASMGRYYVVGGDTSSTNSTATYIYDPALNSWTTGANLPGPKSYGAVAEWGGKIYLFGGYDGVDVSASLWEFDPVAGTFTVKTPGPHPRFRPGMAARNGRLYVSGGGPDLGNPYAATDTVDVYDIGTDTWTSAWHMLYARVAHASGTLPDGRIIAAGGLLSTALRTRLAEALAPGDPCPQVGTATPTITSTPSITATPCPMNFSDVQPSDWFFDYVRCLYCRGAISGYADGTFRPYNNTTRGQMTKIVVLGFVLPIQTPSPSETPTFSDVPRGSTFFDYVETAARRAVVSGYADGTFRPNNLVTRGQLSKIVVVAATQVNGWTLLNPATPTFSDVAPGTAFYTYIETAACHGIVAGYADGTFRPGNNATRAQISKIVCLAVRNEGVCAPAGP